MSEQRRQAIMAGIVSLLVVLGFGYATLWGPLGDYRQARSDMSAASAPAPSPEPGSPDQSGAVPRELPDATAKAAIRAAAGNLKVDSITPGTGRRVYGANGPVAHPFTVVVSANPAELAGFTARLQSSARIADGQITGDGPLLTVDSIAPTESPSDAPSRMAVVVNAYSYR